MKKKQIKASIATLLVGVMSPLSMAIPASAGTSSWLGYAGDTTQFGDAADHTWSRVENWYLDQATIDGDEAWFTNLAHSHLVDMDADKSLLKVLFKGERTETSSKSFQIVSTGNHALTITGSIEAIMTGTGGDHSVETDVTLGAATTFKTSGSNTLQIGDTGTTLALGANNLTLDASGGTITIAGEITGSGSVTKSGTGKVKMMATPGTGGFTGGFTVPTGELSIDDASGVNVTVSGGTLKGTGTAGTVTMSSGTVAPGASPGTLNTGNLTFTGGTHAVELGGKAAGEFDKLNVTGTVALGSATTLDVSLVNSFKPAVNDSFVIIENDGSDAVTGTFVDKADGASFTLGSYTYQINYDGGTGNDVVLLVTGTAAASTPDTGVGGILSSPITTIAAALSIAAMLAGYRVYETKKIRK